LGGVRHISFEMWRGVEEGRIPWLSFNFPPRVWALQPGWVSDFHLKGSAADSGNTDVVDDGLFVAQSVKPMPSTKGTVGVSAWHQLRFLAKMNRCQHLQQHSYAAPSPLMLFSKAVDPI